MKRPLVLIPTAILLLIAALAGVAWFYLRHNVTRAAAAKIEAGMTKRQVEDILGGPAGEYFRWQDVEPKLHIDVMGAKYPAREIWIADDFAVFVWFDPADKVVIVDRSDVKIRGSRGFFINGKNVMPEFLRGWIGWDDPEEAVHIEISRADASRLARNARPREEA